MQIPTGSDFEFKNGRFNASPSLKCTLMCWNVGMLMRWRDAPASNRWVVIDFSLGQSYPLRKCWKWAKAEGNAILGIKACRRKATIGRKRSTHACMEDLMTLGLGFL
jgi:hypothetical protein